MKELGELRDVPLEQPDRFSENFKAVGSIVFYMLVSVGLTLLNRFLFIDKSEPSSSVFVSWFQFLVADLFIVVFSGCCAESKVCGFFPVMNLKWKTALAVLPLSVSYLLMIGTNNICLQTVSVSSYQIVRSLSVLFNILLRFIVYKEKTSVKVTLACVAIVIGFALGTNGDLTISGKGLFFGLLSSCMAALYAILVKTTITKLDGNEFLLLQYNTNIALVILTPYVLFNRDVNSMFRCYSMRYWITQFLAGAAGFILNISIFWHIKYTSSLTHNLVGTVKSCVQTLLAYFLFPKYEQYTVQKFIGFTVILVSSFIYAALKNKEGKRKNAEILEDEAIGGEAIQVDVDEPAQEDAAEEETAEKSEL